MKELKEGIDFIWEVKEGIRFRVFTEQYLKRIRQFCCKGGCKNCPWKFNKNKS